MTNVSIVILVKDQADHLANAVATIRRTAPSSEVVIVDNGSSDTTPFVARQLGDVVLSCRGAMGDCRRPGAEQASRQIVFFMDADQRLVEGTVSSACAALQGYEAVVVPERPTASTTVWGTILAAERMWAEASGLGRPRVFWRDRYLEYKPATGVMFGEDTVIARQVTRIAISPIPILHEEPSSPMVLFRKYYRYGKRHRGVAGTVDSAPRATFAYLAGSSRVALGVVPLLPLVVTLKIGKACAFYLGAWRAQFA